MDIEIADYNSGQIIDIMQLYPNGQLVIKYERVFWQTNSAIPNVSLPLQRGGRPTQQSNKMNNVNRGLNAMGDSLMGMMGKNQ